MNGLRRHRPDRDYVAQRRPDMPAGTANKTAVGHECLSQRVLSEPKLPSGCRMVDMRG